MTGEVVGESRARVKSGKIAFLSSVKQGVFEDASVLHLRNFCDLLSGVLYCGRRPCRMQVLDRDVRHVSVLVICDEFTPEWWKFVKGVIESKELLQDEPRITPRAGFLRRVTEDFRGLGCATGRRTLLQQEGANSGSRRVADLVDEYDVCQLEEFVAESLNCNVSSVNTVIAGEFSVAPELGVSDVRECKFEFLLVERWHVLLRGVQPRCFQDCCQFRGVSVCWCRSRCVHFDFGDLDVQWFGLLFRQRPGRHCPSAA